ncbi:MAG: cbb3-type cytochrome c oxidase subunit 3 [Pseudomonadota bacterium]|nr:cbb3-type cytochrome c oxidase subunit 3 [Pseudomonadota bacterium]
MSINELRIAITILSLIVFIGVWVWAWSSRNKSRFAEAALLPFADADRDPAREGRS